MRKLKLFLSLLMLFTFSVGNLWATDYQLVTSTSDLEAGANYVIGSAASGSGVFMATTSNNNNRRGTESITIANGKISATQAVLVLELGGTTGAWTFLTTNYTGTDGYLAAASNNSNYCQVISDGTQARAKFTISFNSNAVVITATGGGNRRNMRYNPNNGSPLFACYQNATDQSPIYLYKEVTSGGGDDPGTQKTDVTDEQLAWSAASATVTMEATDNEFPSLTNSLGLDVTYQSTAEAVATIDDNGDITLVKAGSTTIKAIFAGNDDYNAKTVSYTLTVNPAPLQPIAGGVIDELTITDLGVTASSYTQFTGKQASNENHSEAKYSGYVARNSSGCIQLTSESNTNVRQIASTTSGGTVKRVQVIWATNTNNTDGRVLTVYGNNTGYTGTVRIVANNETKLGELTYHTGDASAYIDIEGNYQYMVIVASGAMYMDQINITWLPSAKHELTFGVAEASAGRGTLAASVGGSAISSGTQVAEGATVTLSPSANQYYQVNAVTVLDGNADEVTTTENDGVYTFTMPTSNTEAEVSFAYIPVTSLTLNKTELELLVDAEETLSVLAVEPENAYAGVDWSSNATDVATVDENGKVTAKAAGTATITATSKVTGTVKATCDVTVTAPSGHAIDITSANGTVVATSGDDVIDVTDVLKDVAVVLTATPNDGYSISGWTIVGLDESDYTISEDKTTCSFNMPDDEVLVEVSYTHEVAVLKLHDANGESIFDSENTHYWKEEVTLPTSAASCSKTFMGWSVNAECAIAPELGATYVLPYKGENHIYAVYADEITPGTTSYVKTALADIASGSEVVVTELYSETIYAIGNDGGTSTGPAAVELAESATDVLNVGDNTNIFWVLTKDGANFSLTVKGGTDKLYCTDTNNGVRVGTNENNVFSISSDYIFNNATSRYVGYNHGNGGLFRCYTTINTNINGETLAFYKKTVGEGTYGNYSTACVASPTAEPASASIAVAAAGGEGTLGVSYENVNLAGVEVALYNNEACTEAFDGGWLTASIAGDDKHIAYNAQANTSYNDARTAYIQLTAPETTGATDPAVVVIPVTQAKKDAVFASLADLVASDLPRTSAGTAVTVSFSNIEIDSVKTKSVYLNIRDKETTDKDIQIYGPSNSSWLAGGLVSGTNIEGTWKLYSNAMELAVTTWEGITYTKPEAPISWSATEAVAYTKGQDYTLPTLNNEESLAVAYSSTNEGVAEIDNTGEVTIKAAGTTTIKATYTEDAYQGKVAEYTLTVYAPTVVITGTPQLAYEYNDVFSFSGLGAKAVYADETESELPSTGLVWTSNPVHVTENGKVQVTVTWATIESEAREFDVTVLTHELTFNATPEHGTVSVLYNDNPVATGDHFVKGDVLTITATPASADYALTSLTVNDVDFVSGDTYEVGTEDIAVEATFTEKPEAPISWSAEEGIVYLPLNVKENELPTLNNEESLTVTYSSYSEVIATVDENTGVITPVAEGMTFIEAIFAGDDTYKPTTVSFLLTVEQLPVKFYVAGTFNGNDDWNAGKVPSYADTYTITDLLANTEYAMKVVDGSSWKGYTDLTSQPHSLETDNDGNIRFKLATAGDVTVTYIAGTDGQFTVEGDFVKPTIQVRGDWDKTQSSWQNIVLTEVALDGKSISKSVHLAANTYNFGVSEVLPISSSDQWRANGAEVSRDASVVTGLTGYTSNMTLMADKDGDYTFTWTYETSTLTVTYPERDYTVTWTRNGTEDVEELGTLVRMGETNQFALTMEKEPAAATYTVSLLADGVATGYSKELVIEEHAKYELYFEYNPDAEQENDRFTALASKIGIATELDNTGDGQKAVKMMKDNTIYIIRGDKTYTITGQVVK